MAGYYAAVPMPSAFPCDPLHDASSLHPDSWMAFRNICPCFCASRWVKCTPATPTWWRPLERERPRETYLVAVRSEPCTELCGMELRPLSDSVASQPRCESWSFHGQSWDVRNVASQLHALVSLVVNGPGLCNKFSVGLSHWIQFAFCLFCCS